MANVVKEILPDAGLFWGLDGFGLRSRVLERFASVDFIIQGDEQPLLTLVQRCLGLGQGQAPVLSDIPNLAYRGNGEIVPNPISYCAATGDLDALDYGPGILWTTTTSTSSTSIW